MGSWLGGRETHFFGRVLRVSAVFAFCGALTLAMTLDESIEGAFGLADVGVGPRLSDQKLQQITLSTSLTMIELPVMAGCAHSADCAI